MSELRLQTILPYQFSDNLRDGYYMDKMEWKNGLARVRRFLVGLYLLAGLVSGVHAYEYANQLSDPCTTSVFVGSGSHTWQSVNEFIDTHPDDYDNAYFKVETSTQIRLYSIDDKRNPAASLGAGDGYICLTGQASE